MDSKHKRLRSKKYCFVFEQKYLLRDCLSPSNVDGNRARVSSYVSNISPEMLIFTRVLHFLMVILLHANDVLENNSESNLSHSDITKIKRDIQLKEVIESYLSSYDG